MKKISTCLWFDHQAAEAVALYEKVFQNFRTRDRDKFGVAFTMENLDVFALNGGPLFKLTPANSYFVRCASVAEIDEKWARLSAGGEVRMSLDKYPWAEKYGWTVDKFGVDWQLIVQNETPKISPAFLFVDALFGRGKEALGFWTSVFPDSRVERLSEDPSGRSILHAAFKLNGGDFVLSEGPGRHGYAFTEAFSFALHCKDQAEIDHYWNALTAGGGSPSQCGWCKDKFGVSWQVLPENIQEIMGDPRRAAIAMNMQKLDLAALR